MEIGGVIERAERLAGVAADGAATKAELSDALVAARELDAWVEARRATVVSQLASVDSFPESTIAEANRTSIGRASKSRERADTLAETPTLSDALGDGAITAGHVDAVTRAGKQLDESQRHELFDRIDDLTDVAKAGTVEEFAKRVRLEADRIRSGDGMDRLERQRRDTRVSTWVDQEGMWNLKGRFDPVTGVKLAAKIDETVETLFAESTPELVPTDAVEKQRFLAAHALARLIQDGAGGGKPGRVEILAVVDATPAAAGVEPGGLTPSQVT